MRLLVILLTFLLFTGSASACETPDPGPSPGPDPGSSVSVETGSYDGGSPEWPQIVQESRFEYFDSKKTKSFGMFGKWYFELIWND